MSGHINTDTANHQKGEEMADLVTPEELPAIATASQMAAILQTTVDSLAQDRYRRRGVPWIKIGGRVRYLREDVLDYLSANRIGGDAA
jgi:hypothetical protein